MNRSKQSLVSTVSNPFTTRFIRAGSLPFRFNDDGSIDDVLSRLSNMRWVGQIVGPHGSGKTTLLRTLDPYWQAWNRQPATFTLRDRQRLLPSGKQRHWPRRTQVIIDGYEQLSWIARTYVRLRCHIAQCGLLVTTHHPAMLPIVFETTTNLALANELVNELLGNNPNGELIASAVETCFVKSKGNLRETFLSLYDVYRG